MLLIAIIRLPAIWLEFWTPMHNNTNSFQSDIIGWLLIGLLHIGNQCYKVDSVVKATSFTLFKSLGSWKYQYGKSTSLGIEYRSRWGRVVQSLANDDIRVPQDWVLEACLQTLVGDPTPGCQGLDLVLRTRSSPWHAGPLQWGDL